MGPKGFVRVTVLLITEHPAEELIGETGLTRVHEVLEARVIEEGNFTVMIEEEGTLWAGFIVT